MELAVHRIPWSVADLMPWRRSAPVRRALRAPLGNVAYDRSIMTGQTEWPSLIAAIAERQDKAAFAALFEYFAPRVKALMLRSGANETNAEELAQETLLAVWRKAALFDASSQGAAGWIFTIARNLRIDAHRREMRGGMAYLTDAELEFQLDEAPQPDAILAAGQDEGRVRAALSKLSEEQIRVVELSFFEERAHAEISILLNIPLGTVKSRLRLAMNRLRLLLSETQ